MPITRGKVRAGVLLFLSALLALAATADANGLRALKPGEFVVHDQTVPVDLVFIGYDRQLIDEKATATRSSTGCPAATWAWSSGSGIASSSRVSCSRTSSFRS